MRTLIATTAALLLAVPLVASVRAQDPQTRQQAPQASRQTPISQPSGGQANQQLVTGTFVLTQPEAQAQQGVNRSIEEAANHVGFFERGFVRSKLRDKNPVRSPVRTEIHGDRLAVTYGQDRYETVQGQTQTVNALGEAVQLRQYARGNQIFQNFRSKDGNKAIVMTFRPDGRMDMDVTVTSGRLPQPLRYRLQYRRAGGGTMAAAR